MQGAYSYGQYEERAGDVWPQTPEAAYSTPTSLPQPLPDQQQSQQQQQQTHNNNNYYPQVSASNFPY